MPNNGIMNASSAIPGSVWSTPTDRMNASAPPRRALEQQAERQRDDDRDEQRERNELDVPHRQTRDRAALIAEVRPQTSARHNARRRVDRRRATGEAERGERIARNDAHRCAVNLDAFVQRAHA